MSHLKYRLARLCAIQAIYQIDISKSNSEDVIREFLKYRLTQNRSKQNSTDIKLFCSLVKNTCNNIQVIDSMISQSITEDWKFERLDLVLKSILRVGIAELMMKFTHCAVIISEYVNITYSFYNKKESNFINKMLDNLNSSINNKA